VEVEPLSGRVLAAIRAEFPALEPARAMHELVRRMISLMIHDVLAETARRIDASGVRNVDDVRRFGAPLVGFSAELEGAEQALKTLLLHNLYRHETVMRPVRNAERIVADLFAAFCADPLLMPDPWGRDVDPGGGLPTARRVVDYIAGMTDRYAVSEHRRLFDDTPDLG
ncbi:MAG TPA: deoxyguanosinetriphosphate triphosphohydrolase, partial [Afifellaceae bacterium]|nr:deoxyguanosinetriphosphate triphosphohydrolase [Afifellaceae bacterium]